MRIRSEQVTDYAEIGALHARAFGNRSGESLVVALQRQRRVFDPELSLVADIDRRIVGHVLFSPYQMRLLDQTVPTVNLAPIAVDLAYQGQGIGSRLITEGHAVAASKGFIISILLGHTTYYPRFGYHTHAFGFSLLTLPINVPAHTELEVRGPTNEDLPTLGKLWWSEEQAVDMSLEPGPDLLDWLSPHPAIRAAVYTRDNEVVGYSRVHQDKPTQLRVFLARDAATARAMLSTMASKLTITPSETTFILPLHPFSASAQSLGYAESTAWAAGMACELAPGLLPNYLTALREKRRPAGRPIWPVAFDLA
jgi:putative acetyltransferase